MEQLAVLLILLVVVTAYIVLSGGKDKEPEPVDDAEEIWRLDADDLMKMTKNEIKEYAATLGITLDSRKTKAAMIAELIEQY